MSARTTDSQTIALLSVIIPRITLKIANKYGLRAGHIALINTIHAYNGKIVAHSLRHSGVRAKTEVSSLLNEAPFLPYVYYEGKYILLTQQGETLAISYLRALKKAERELRERLDRK